jgi:mandelate racemase
MSSHLFPKVSAHLLAAAPTCRWLEWVGWAEKILADSLPVKDGCDIVPDHPGNGFEWNKMAVEKYRM